MSVFAVALMGGPERELAAPFVECVDPGAFYALPGRKWHTPAPRPQYGSSWTVGCAFLEAPVSFFFYVAFLHHPAVVGSPFIMRVRGRGRVMTFPEALSPSVY